MPGPDPTPIKSEPLRVGGCWNLNAVFLQHACIEVLTRAVMVLVGGVMVFAGREEWHQRSDKRISRGTSRPFCRDLDEGHSASAPSCWHPSLTFQPPEMSAVTFWFISHPWAVSGSSSQTHKDSEHPWFSLLPRRLENGARGHCGTSSCSFCVRLATWKAQGL